ncbi:MAG: hypothetical protein F4230_03640 [Holophagales bacterium]|nr:hypothetical protein [Holophagales bacterium]MYF04095.1 hypothetical protein [Holophagales bacterium]MYJ26205.1 hypothetical protein [Holophagales bacterium]
MTPRPGREASPLFVEATPEDASRSSGLWLFVDVGFSRRTRSCGFAVDDCPPEELTFGCLVQRTLDVVSSASTPINLLLEAPLSAAFNKNGNPTGRRIEKRGSQVRYWYLGPACVVLVAATYLLRQIREATLKEPGSTAPIRLFEGFASFKEGRGTSSHVDDVSDLRNVAWGRAGVPGKVVWADDLKMNESDTLRSAFAVSGMDLGVPPVVLVGEES